MVARRLHYLNWLERQVEISNDTQAPLLRANRTGNAALPQSGKGYRIGRRASFIETLPRRMGEVGLSLDASLRKMRVRQP